MLSSVNTQHPILIFFIELASTPMSFQVPASSSPSQLFDFDVLSLIFEHVALSDIQGPIISSHVSRFWREVALESPRIWSNVTIKLEANTMGIPQQHLWAFAYFNRSKNLPIILNIHASRHFETWEKEKLLLPQSHRFVSLHFKASEGSVANMLWMQMGTNMPLPNLEVFDTEISGSSRITLNRNPEIATDDSENIIPPVCDSLVFWDHWKPTGLTALTLETACLWNKPDFDDICDILATRCHTLQRFHYLGLISSIDDTGVNRNHLEFPELRTLTVFCNDDMVPLLRLMIIPTLESLILRDFVQYPAAIPTRELIEDDIFRGIFFLPNILIVINHQSFLNFRVLITSISSHPSTSFSSQR